MTGQHSWLGHQSIDLNIKMSPICLIVIHFKYIFQIFVIQGQTIICVQNSFAWKGSSIRFETLRAPPTPGSTSCLPTGPFFAFPLLQPPIQELPTGYKLHAKSQSYQFSSVFLYLVICSSGFAVPSPLYSKLIETLLQEGRGSNTDCSIKKCVKWELQVAERICLMNCLCDITVWVPC